MIPTKKPLTLSSTLQYFDSWKPIVIQVDASQKGLGAALLQDGRPITFASKALTPTEQRYANIEREMLACVFGAERFHTYVFGRSFTIESDHKPLEQINLKNLADTPARLQRMLLCLQNYDVKITYRPGREMLVADTLSRNNRTAHCTHSEDQHSTQDSCMHTHAFTSSTHWSCATADRCSTCCPAPICPCH